MTGDVPICLMMVNVWMDRKGEEGKEEGEQEERMVVASEVCFLLQDGTIGIIREFVNPPIWKQKPNVKVTCIHGFHFPRDGEYEDETIGVKSLLVGYADGTLEARCGNTGEVFWADGLDGTVVVSISSFGDEKEDARACTCVVLESGAVHIFKSLEKAGAVIVDAFALMEAEIEEMLEKKHVFHSYVYNLVYVCIYCANSFLETPSTTTKIKLKQQIQPTELKIRVIYESMQQKSGPCPSNDRQLHFLVYTQTLPVPEFPFFKSIPITQIRQEQHPEFIVGFNTKASVSDLIKWMQASFLDTGFLTRPTPKDSTFKTTFLHVPTSTLYIVAKDTTKFTIQTTLTSLNQTTTLSTIASIISSYSKFFGHKSFKVVTNKRFGSLSTEIKVLLGKVGDLRAAKASGRVKALDGIPLLKGLMRRVEVGWEIEDV
ncbi:UNVERIFIED_CONTAM: hypothetical protein HDU68_001541 [Siphonaria sp. JEL0065]|nr:hypothetical protein HDU68_001541 [Siphonaria sp. JEL0065]